MITKISQIVSISRFKHFASSDSRLSLGKITMLYAPNGRGKTSIADIVKSLATNDPSYIEKRYSHVYPGNAEITVSHSDPMITSRFTSGAWTNPPIGMSCIVFDKDFIQQNIHTVTVEHDHKKKLHGLIVGEGAIAARENIKIKRDALLNVQKSQRDVILEFNSLGTKGLTLDIFTKLAVGDFTKLSSEKEVLEKQLEALGNPEIIKQKPKLNALIGISIDTEQLKKVCEDTLRGGSKEAIELISSHANTCIKLSTDESKDFLARGVKALGTIGAEKCALCGQILQPDTKALVDALFTIFSSAYLNLRRDVLNCDNVLKTLNTDSVIRQIQQTLELNKSRFNEWLKYINPLSEPTYTNDLSKIGTDIQANVKLLQESLKRKLDDLSLKISKEPAAIIEDIKLLNDSLDSYNTMVGLTNIAVDDYRNSLDTNKKQELSKRIDELSNLLIRSSDKAKDICDRNLKLTTEVDQSDKAHKESLLDFSNAQQIIMDAHGTMINQILAYCGAKFRLDGLTQGSRTGSTEPYLEYVIKLNGGVKEASTSAADALGQILSEGEKNLLAFAFFWSLINHSDLTATIAIFDDPLSSVDEAWRLQLIDKLKELNATGLQQLFILTHYNDFARTVVLKISDIQQITINAGGSSIGNTLDSYDIEAVSKELQFKRIDKIQNFIDDPTTAEPKDIQAEIRTVLEAALKFKYYKKLSVLMDGKKWLRDFIEDPGVKPILETNGSYILLDTLCTTGGWANHDNPPSLIFSQDQACAYAVQTLQVLEKI